MPIRKRVVIVIIAALVGTALLRMAGAFEPVERVGRWVLMPFTRALAATGSTLAKWTGHEPGAAELRERNQELEARLVSLAVDYVRLRALEEENRALQALAKFVSDSGYDHVSARIIARSTDPRRATILIDRGSSDGLETGMGVVAGEGVFVGKITELKEHVATVMLVSDEQSRVAAGLAGQPGLFGLVEGRGNAAARLTLVPQQAPLERDGVIVTAGTEDKIPGNLAIGLVNDVEGKPTDPFKSASLEPLAKTDRLDIVIVLRSAALRPKEEGI